MDQRGWIEDIMPYAGGAYMSSNSSSPQHYIIRVAESRDPRPVYLTRTRTEQHFHPSPPSPAKLAGGGKTMQQSRSSFSSDLANPKILRSVSLGGAAAGGGAGAGTVALRTHYESINDPHLQEFFERKFKMSTAVSQSYLFFLSHTHSGTEK